MPKYVSTSLIKNVSLATPAVRTVVVTAWALDDGAIEHEITPVLAIRESIVQRYHQSVDDVAKYPCMGATHEELLDYGWHAEEPPESEIDAVITDPEFGLVGARFAYSDCINLAYRICAAHWPESEDSVRLQRTIEELGEEATRRRERRLVADGWR